jgi:erythronate-4-phosphate dehydrogenase
VTSVNEDLLKGTSVRFVGSATSGIDHVDLDWLHENGIKFSSAPGCNANSVVEYVLCAIAEIDDYWERLEGGGQVGILGFGHVGKCLAKRLKALNITYIVYDPWLSLEGDSFTDDLNEVFNSDVVTLHAALCYEEPWPSRHIINSSTLQEISKDSLLINAARGELIDTSALLDLFRRGFGPNVVCDVWEDEPSISKDLLNRVRIGTPHIAGYSFDGKLLGTMMLSKVLYSFLGIKHDAESICLDPPSAVKILSGASSADTARNILRGFYRINKDDDNLRHSLTGHEEQDSFSFDSLRSNYYERREAYGSSILDTGLELHQLTMAKGLGCKVLSDH